MPVRGEANPLPQLNDVVGDVVELASGALHVLANPYPLDGSVSWHPEDARGYAPMNCYLYVDGDDALLVDTGLTVHERSVLRQLAALRAGALRLAVFPLRVGEYDSVCNMAAIVERFSPHAIYALGTVAGPGWFDVGDDRVDLTGIDLRRVGREDVIELGARRLVAFEPAVRLLNTHWIYDHASRSLLTSDMFGHVARATSTGPWIVDAADRTTLEEVEHHMLETRYWWLRGARTDGLRRALAELLDRFEIDFVGPAFGCALRGRAVVERHFALVDETLRRASRLPAPYERGRAA